MDSNMSTAYVHRGGSTSSSCSGGTGIVRGTGTGSGSGGRVAVVGVTRSVRLRRRGPSGFGFSLRGGREHAAGFYVSDVQPGGEAHKNGLRIGDQIVRVNGYPVEDAVHQEVALLAKTQQVLVLKIRSVGMIPVKDNPNDPVTWHMVQQQQKQQLSESGSGIIPSSTEVRIRVVVGAKGRLGCGVCKGPMPGLTVQGTREDGAARAAGLRPGDVIVWCNGHPLTDIPFERAVEVMRSSAVLDLLVSRPSPNHHYDHDHCHYHCHSPVQEWMRGSSGYDSESSSSSPPPVASVPANTPGRQGHSRNRSREVQWGADVDSRGVCCPLASSTDSCSSSADWSHVDQVAEWTRKPNNTTVIRVNQNQNQRINCENGSRDHPRVNQPPPYGRPTIAADSSYRKRGGGDEEIFRGEEPLYDPVAVSCETYYFDNDPQEGQRCDLRKDERGGGSPFYDPAEASRHCGTKSDAPEGSRLAEIQLVRKQTETEAKTVTTVEIHQHQTAVCQPPPPPPPSMPPTTCSYKCQTQPESKPMNAIGIQMGSTMSMGSTGSTETEDSTSTSASTSSSLSSSSCEPASTSSFASTTTVRNMSNRTTIGTTIGTTATPRSSGLGAAAIPHADLGSAIAQELQRRAHQRTNGGVFAKVTKEREKETEKLQESLKPLNGGHPAHEQRVAHNKLMEEFKRAHQRMFNAGSQTQLQRLAIGADGAETLSQGQASIPQDEAQTIQQERRANGSLASHPPPAPPPPPPPPGKSQAAAKLNANASDDAVEMQSIESFKLKGPPTLAVPKPPSTYFPPAAGDRNRSLEKSEPQTRTANENASNSKAIGKVAIRISAYTGESKPPAKLDFLAPQPQLESQRVAKGNNDPQVKSGPVVSRLQNELAATLQRSNLKNKSDRENVIGTGSIANITPVTTSSDSQDRENPAIAVRSNVEKLAAALGNKVTIKVNPESVNRQE